MRPKVSLGPRGSCCVKSLSSETETAAIAETDKPRKHDNFVTSRKSLFVTGSPNLRARAHTHTYLHIPACTTLDNYDSRKVVVPEWAAFLARKEESSAI